jgi:tetratricopeptide (TPR) repeat protein
MRIFSSIAIALLILIGLHEGYAGPFGVGRAGGGGARPAGGGAAARPAFHGSPSFSGAGRPQMNRPNSGAMAARPNRPSGGSMIPHTQPGGGYRPGGAIAGGRPGGGNQLASLNRPGAGGNAANRPNLSNRPGAGGGGTQWPNAGNRPGAGGSNWVNRPGAGGSGTQWPNAGNRPGGGGTNWANRPGAGGSGTQWANRPGGGGTNWANRPGAGGSGTQWPNAGNRPDWANRPGGGGTNWANRPGAGGSGTQWANAGNRPNWANRPGNWNNGNWNNANWNNRPGNWVNNGSINAGNTVVNQNNFNQNNIASNRFNNFNNRPWGYNAYQSNWAGWHSGSWNNWNSTPAAWYTAGAATAVGSSLLWGAGTNYTYSNPFYVASPTVVTTPALDYSQPVQVPAPVNVVDSTSYSSPATYDYPVADDSTGPDLAPVTTESPEASPPPSTPAVPPEANDRFDAAREAFKSEQYDKALNDVEEAIKLLPKDTTLHEFRALVLFAQGKYKEAAAGIYAVLAVGPGWNWETMSGLYGNPDTYTKQLRALESYVRQNLNAADGRFLLAYHYLVLNSIPQAVTELKEFEKLVPKDELAPELVKAFTESPDTGKPKAQGA